MIDQDLAFTPAWKLRDLIVSRKVSPVELTELFLSRIYELNPGLNAYLTVSAEEAMADARKAEAATKSDSEIGVLHGVPISIKDLNMTKGVRTTFGSRAYQNFVPDADEVAVARIRSAGAIILGKTNTPEFGLSATTENLLGDACRNPWDPERTSGGSSGGAGAGLAAGLHPLAQGSDGGGSIRIPSSMCGVYGIKPTQGRVPRPYMKPGGWGQFSQNGPMTRSVRDAAILLQVMSGPDAGDPTAISDQNFNFYGSLDNGVRGKKIGWSVNLGSLAVDPEVQSATEKAIRVFEELGANVEEAKIELDHQRIWELFQTVFFSDFAANYNVVLSESSDLLGPSSRAIAQEVSTWPIHKLSLALRELEWHRESIDSVIRNYDVLLTPTLATTAFPIGDPPGVIDGQEVNPRFGFTPFTYPINMSGHPAASVPCGFSLDGLPIGLHIIGQKRDEAGVLQVSAAFESAQPWADKRPVVC
jgi:aspartyl-tRNA(Asn)/glutamyl-tRNA(Gln) amidotransferase subunit A